MKKDKSGLFLPIKEHFDKHGKEYEFVQFECEGKVSKESYLYVDTMHSDGGYNHMMCARYDHKATTKGRRERNNRCSLSFFIINHTEGMYNRTGYSARRMEELFRVANMIINLMVKQMKINGDADAESFARDCIKEAMKKYHRGNDGTKWTKTNKLDGGLEK